ncbi:MAG: PorP/SprF family type IX secretion system membrane protein [Bacteroidales bacterium]|nr:PorP/SprF family type IX secretion system membrane protein [Bacteroidales bacterium]
MVQAEQTIQRCKKPEGIFARTILFLAVLVFGFAPARAQDAAYSHFVASGIYLNPALAGSYFCHRFKLFHREQWTSIPRAYSHTHITFDWYSNKIEAGLGFSYKNDSQGDGILQMHNLRVSYSKPVQLNINWLMNAGVYAAYSLRQLNWSKLTFADQLDPDYGFIHGTGVTPPDHTSIHHPDFGVGFTFNYQDVFYSGFTVNHLFMPRINYYSMVSERLDLKYSGHLGYVISLEQNWPQRRWERNATLTPNLLFEKQGDFYHVTTGLYFSKEPIFTGIWVRHAFENIDAIIFTAGIQQAKYKIGYSYDMTVSPLTARTSGGSHEISLTWYLDCADHMQRRCGTYPCPPSFLK